MYPLSKALRNELERAIENARVISEEAALASLLQLGVGQDQKDFEHLTDEEKALRDKLIIHGKQLGDSSKSNDLLIEEIAYEHWHRMLFARFLAENDLLMYPDPNESVSVTIEDCEELAGEQGARNGWELAARFASQMLPQIFRVSSPVFEIQFTYEYQTKLEKILTNLNPDIFQASDSLGWVYQFWQSKRKDEVNKSEVKIGARELPAVTQLFTEAYMVSFLLDNSLGAWWANKRLKQTDYQTASSELELRKKASIEGVPLEFLRFVKEDEGFALASGGFEKLPADLGEWKVLDPCCGSGHFLVAVFLMLVPIRMELESLSAKDAVDKVLSENLHGLDVDKRVTEIAAFALALTAWKYPNTGGYRPLPELHIACSGLAVGVEKENWKKLGGNDTNLKTALGWLYDEFQNAPVLGSLLDPSKSDAAKLVKWDDLSVALGNALDSPDSPNPVNGEKTPDPVNGEKTPARGGWGELETAVVAHGLAKAGKLLTSHYHWVVTNVPYLARGKQSDVLKNFCEKNYSEARNDLATVFLDRILDYCHIHGTASVVLPQNWLFLTSYKKFRIKLLLQEEWNFIARLGPAAFETISGEVVKAILLTITKRGFQPSNSQLFQNDRIHYIRGIDVSSANNPFEKSRLLISNEIKSVEQHKQLNNPDARVALDESDDSIILSKYAISMRGIVSGDNDKWERVFCEIPSEFKYWKFLQTTPRKSQYYTGKELIINWIEKGKEMLRPGTTNEAYGKYGVAIGQMTGLPATLYYGSLYDNNTGVIVPSNKMHLLAIWCYCSSPEYNEAVRRIDQKLNVTNATLVKVPFDLEYWTKVAEAMYPNGLPEPYSDDPTQWIYHGHPCGSVVWNEETKQLQVAEKMRIDETVLQVAVARLLGYSWPAETDEGMELAKEQREWITKCESLSEYVDEDGIVCIPPVRGEERASDRLMRILATSYGSEWTTDVLSKLLETVGYTGKTLEAWLRDGFFMHHCKIFHHRPFLWQIWDGLPDGFSAIVNYHKFDYKTLETLLYTYLGDWISRQKQDLENKVDGADEKIAAAERLRKQLELILMGEKPYDIFIRWKTLKKQPIGWNPDLNDGVRMNIRPFMSGVDIKKKGAGVLRDKPNIKWSKDRGKDVQSAPWFSVFKGDRINDHHTTIKEKKKERGEL
ncbi:MAG: N-6 DNA methylase [Leptospiraceae bacterium]|nr:N-6 DNA methylase [Leptospiraceae bacterium]